jgi:hypothetical protein
VPTLLNVYIRDELQTCRPELIRDRVAGIFLFITTTKTIIRGDSNVKINLPLPNYRTKQKITVLNKVT